MSEFVKDVTDRSFEADVLKAEVPVLVDFWATWCAPCRMLTPIIEQVAEEYKDRAKLVKLNVDNKAETAGRYSIRGIPTLLLFKNGELKDQLVGVTSKNNITRIIDAQL